MAKHHGMKHHRKSGGTVADAGGTPKPYNAVGSPVEHEAEEKKHGGHVKKKHGGTVEGHKPRHTMHHRPGRKRGGSVGSNLHPLSTAAHGKDASGHKADAGDSASEVD